MPFHPDQNLPGCMMPDGGECCAGHAAVCDDWHKQRREIDRITAERDGLLSEVECLNSNARVQAKLLADTGRERDSVMALNAQMLADNERMEEALHKIDSWGRAYPLTVFPEPDLKKARELLAAGGITLDAVSASCMRHVVEGVGKIAREALAALTPSVPDAEKKGAA